MPKHDNPLLDTTIVCMKCSVSETLHWVPECNERLHRTQRCFICDHWEGHKLADKTVNSKKYVIVDGHHYLIGSAADDGGFRGFGGSEFKIKFNDGREVTTRNLWHQGVITAHFRNEMPDNAVFVSDFKQPKSQ